MIRLKRHRVNNQLPSGKNYAIILTMNILTLLSIALVICIGVVVYYLKIYDPHG